MSSYIGKVQIGEQGDQILVGSTLFGTCASAIDATAKIVTLNDFDHIIKGVTVHIRFNNGNNVTSGLTLAIGGTLAQPVIGNCVCNANDTVAFTYWEETINSNLIKGWYVNSNIVAAEGSANGQIKINGYNVNVHGLNSAAYSSTTDFATAAQGTLAENAMPKSGGTFTGPVILNADPTSAMGAATKNYVDNIASGLENLNSPMHFIGETPTTDNEGNPILPDAQTSYTNYVAGDVLLVGYQEYVYSKGTNAASSRWILLGDEGSYVLKTSQTTGNVGSAANWDAGSASEATVANGVLYLTNSTVPTLQVTSTPVIVPVSTP